MVRQVRDSNRRVHVGFVDDRGREVAAEKVVTIRTAAYPTTSDRTTSDRTGSNPMQPLSIAASSPG